ncbi:metal-dependent phosphohydrolase [Thermopolyspora sp. NPDC052614]|uniref:HD domain-containing protein n=1 Tax=Thermopolyspora sp. NPDC052614 TaxID=3155682 RepID=UPI003418AAE8
MEPSAGERSAAEPSTAKLLTAGRSTAEPSTARPFTVGAVAAQDADASALLSEWRRVVPASPASDAVAAELLARWSEPHRRYHTRAHLRAVLTAIDPLATAAADPAAVRLAAWFHDAVYDGHPGQDEERSAQLAQSHLPRCGVPPERVAEAARLVRLTATHAPAPGDRNGEVLCDADLAILAAPRDAYAAYTRAIREEYRHIPDELFALGRSQVLRNLLAMPRLYRTPAAHDLWETAARANIAAELSELTALS